ncbi:MAG: GAF domain-containing sensor histidine kinase [Actinomycetota bacterium]
MRGPWHRAAPWIVFWAIVAVSLTTMVVALRDQGILPLISVASVSVGTLILVRARNRIGWLFDLAAMGGLVLSISGAYLFLHATSMPGLPGAGYAAVMNKVSVFPPLTAFALILLWFPDGRPLSRRWAPIGWLVVTSAVVLAAGSFLQPGPTDANYAGGIDNPMGVRSLEEVVSGVISVGAWAMLLGTLGCVASLFVRFRRASGDERQQLRWLAAVGGLAAVFFGLTALAQGLAAPEVVGNLGWGGFMLCIIIGIPAAVVLAIFKYHLYDIDVVISKTIVYGLLAVFIGAVYVAIVVGVSAVIPVGADSPLLSIAATGVVALLFQPARDRVQRLANRIVYGQRSTPYEVLARFSERVGNTYATEDILPRTARVIAEAVNAERATIWLLLADELRPTAGWPEVDAKAEAVSLAGDELPPLPGEHVAAIRYRGDLLGAISVEKTRGEPMNPGEIRLVEDLAVQAGLVVSNVRLTADLEARLEVIARQSAELRASRQRIVAAQDEERRRLERNIHDGAQQHLVALAVKLRLARGLVSRDPERARAMLGETARQIDEALETLHALAVGIYPPRLETEGVAAALAARFTSSDLPVRFHASGIGRYPLYAEAAVYFCVLEALQNAAKYARARVIDVTFAAQRDTLTFQVVDDGTGFDPSEHSEGTGLHGMRDRLAVLGGDVSLISAPGRGTIVRGRVPLTAEVPA